MLWPWLARMSQAAGSGSFSPSPPPSLLPVAEAAFRFGLSLMANRCLLLPATAALMSATVGLRARMRGHWSCVCG